MPRYFFNVYHYTAESDDVGAELPNQEVALAEATKTAGQIIQDLDGRLQAGIEWRMEVTDEFGNDLFVIRLLAERAN